MEKMMVDMNMQCKSITILTMDGYEITLIKVSSLNFVFSFSPKPVFIMHGFLQDSDSFLCGGRNSLVYELVHSGYDVYLGNNRGNKHSSNGLPNISKQEHYWNFSMDEIILYDVPCAINYIYELTGHRVAVIGFSQGSTQIFGAISMANELNISNKISLFIALAPAISIPKMQHSLNSYTKMIYHYGIKNWPMSFFDYMFGKQSIFAFAQYCQQHFPIILFVILVRIVMFIAFGWTCNLISLKKQCTCFKYIYSPGSVKNAFHWYQISEQGGLCIFNNYYDTQVTNKRYDLTAITKETCPIALISGDCDTVIVTDSLHQLLPNANIVLDHHIEGYEHLDMLWADDVHLKVNPFVMSMMCRYA